MAMALSDDAMLARFGIAHAQPFDWGDEPHITIDDAKIIPTRPSYADPNAPLSGLDSLKEFVQEKHHYYDRGNKKKDDGERDILRSLLAGARVDFSAAVTSSSEPAHRQQQRDDPDISSSVPQKEGSMEQALMGDTLRDVSIKGLSDRAVAEYTVESRTSLFGSILRLFDVPKDKDKGDEKAHGNNSASAAKKKGDEAVKDAGVGKDEDKGGVIANVVKVFDPPATKSDPATNTAEPVANPMYTKEPILSTAEIVRSVHLTSTPGDIPAGMDSKEYTMAVLQFLSSHIPYLHENEGEYRTTDSFNKQSQEGWDQLRKTLPVLPLIKATNPGESLELRNYGRVRPLIKLGRKERKEVPDSMDRDQTFRKKVLNLERIYSSSLPFSASSTAERLQSKLASSASSSTATISPSSKAPNHASANDLPFAFQRYVPRRKLVPHIEGGAKEELTLMISGHMQQPQHTPGPKPKSAKSKTTATACSGKVTSGTKSAAPASSMATPTNIEIDKEKGVTRSFSTPSKRRNDTAATDDTLHPLKKVKEFYV